MKEPLLYRYALVSICFLLLWSASHAGAAYGAAMMPMVIPYTVTLSNGYRITFQGVTNHADNSSTWGYTVEALPGAKRLQKWVLALPACTTIVAALPEPWTAVQPDPNTGLTGIRWQKFAKNFQQGSFSITLTGPVLVGEVQVATRAPTTAYGIVAGPVCDPDTLPIVTATPTAMATPTAPVIPTVPAITPTATDLPFPTLTPTATPTVLIPTETAEPTATKTATNSPTPLAEATATPSVTPQAGNQALQVSKTDYLWIDANEDALVSAGDTLLYEIRVVNQGAATLTDIRLRDTLSVMTTLLRDTVRTDQSAVVVGQETTAHDLVVEIARLAHGSTAIISFQARLAPALTGGQLANQAVVTFDAPAGQGGGIATVVSDDPDTPGAFDPTLTPLAGGAPVIYLPLVARFQ